MQFKTTNNIKTNSNAENILKQHTTNTKSTHDQMLCTIISK